MSSQPTASAIAAAVLGKAHNDQLIQVEILLNYYPEAADVDPTRYHEKALILANQALEVAQLYKRSDLEARARLFKAHALRALRNWRGAHWNYVRAASRCPDAERLTSEMLVRIQLQGVEEKRRAEESRRRDGEEAASGAEVTVTPVPDQPRPGLRRSKGRSIAHRHTGPDDV
ncbi:hypothetical protein RB595_002575 [Gaeumannomyces hyphopodioides]